MMAHPLYHQATRLVGQPVYVHHLNGAVHHGTLMSVAPHGIYVMPHPVGTRLASADNVLPNASHAMQSQGQTSNDIDLVYGPAAFFGFGALTGLTAAAMFSPFWW